MVCNNFFIRSILLLTTLVYSRSSDDNLKPFPCSSDIYCHGRLLNTIQMAKIYNDSKKFVDMKMRYGRNETLRRFDAFMDEFNYNPTKNEVRDFVENTFEPEGQEFEKWEPTDWTNNPKFLENVKDTALKMWASELNVIWKFLGKKMKPEVKKEQHLYSIIWIPNPVIVPGGRFREFYYWDSYWIIQGLLLSEMFTTVRGILENFLYIVDTYGHIPNGGRIYYLARSQPPLLIPMVKSYLSATRDTKFVIDNLPTMEREFDFWMKNHTRVVDLDSRNYTLAVYGDYSLGPRPESYSEDVDTASAFHTQETKEAYYSELKAAAESGWDFSSRWFVTNATNKGNLTNIKTRSIVPVDLNAILHWNAVLLSQFNSLAGNRDKAQYYADIAARWLEAVEVVLWHEEVGVWLDYDFQNGMKRDYFAPSNMAPLWTGCYNTTRTDRIVEHVMRYLQSKNILKNYPGGIPTTVEHTGEQWDFPNAWPPLQHMTIVGLRNTGIKSAEELAFQIAERWVRSNYRAYNSTEIMYEKYDATVPGGYGGGGEYALQEGFGWTNGIIMDLLNMYGDRLRSAPSESLDSSENSESPSVVIDEVTIEKTTSTVSYSLVSTALLALLISVGAGFIGVCIYKKKNSASTKETKKISEISPKRKLVYAEPDNTTRRMKTVR